MKHIAVFFLLILSPFCVKAETYYGSVSFGSQQDIDIFFSKNCEVDTIIGNVSITNYPTSTNFNVSTIHTLESFERLRFIDGSIYLIRCHALESLDGLSNGLHISQGIILNNLLSLNNLDALLKINVSQINIDYNVPFFFSEGLVKNEYVTNIQLFRATVPNMDFVTKFPNITSLRISTSLHLNNIQGIDELQKLKYLYIYRNESIDDCTLDSLCMRLEGGMIFGFDENDESCNTLKDVKDNCPNSYISCIDSTMVLSTQSMVNNLFLGEGICTEDVTSLTIRSIDSLNAITSLVGLPAFPNVKILNVSNNSRLSSLEDLVIESELSTLVIYNNAILENVPSNLNFQSESKNISIYDNPELISISGLTGIHNIEYLRISNNNPFIEISENFLFESEILSELYLGNINELPEEILNNIKKCDELVFKNLSITEEQLYGIEILSSIELVNVSNVTQLDFEKFQYLLNIISISELPDLNAVTNITLRNSAERLVIIDSPVTNITFKPDLTLDFLRTLLITNTNLSSFEMPNIDYLSYLIVNENKSLQSLNVFSKSPYIREIRVEHNENLLSLGDSTQLNGKLANLSIVGNNSLENIDVFDTNIYIEYVVTITDNPELSSCQIQGICNSIEESTYYFIENNGTECDLPYLINNCGGYDFQSSPVWFNNITVDSQSDIETLKEQYSSIDSIKGNLTIKFDFDSPDHINDLSFFDSLVYIGKTLNIEGKGNPDSLIFNGDLSVFDNIDYGGINISELTFNSIPISSSIDRLNSIELENVDFDNDLSQFDEIDTLAFLYLKNIKVATPLTGFGLLEFCDQIVINNVDCGIDNFLKGLQEVNRITIVRMNTEDLTIFSGAQVNSRLSIANMISLHDFNNGIIFKENCDIKISGTDGMFSMEGITNGAQINDFYMYDMDGQADLSALNNITIKTLRLHTINQLENLEFEKVELKEISIDQCKSLEEINFSNLENIDVLEVTSCYALDIINLPKLKKANYIHIKGNRINNLDSIAVEADIKLISVEGNSQLVTCNLPLICNNLDKDNKVHIYNNSGECENQSVVLEYCGYPIPTCPTSDFSIGSEEDYIDYVDNYSSCQHFPGSLFVNKEFVQDSSILKNTKTIFGSLNIFDSAESVSNLDLSNLIYLSGNLNVASGHFSSNNFDKLSQIGGAVSLNGVYDDAINLLPNVIMDDDINILNCNKLDSITIHTNRYEEVLFNSCPRLVHIDPTDSEISTKLSLMELPMLSLNENLKTQNWNPSTTVIQNLDLVDTFNSKYFISRNLYLLDNDNLEILDFENFVPWNHLVIGNNSKLENIDLNFPSEILPRSIEIYDNEKLTTVVLTPQEYFNSTYQITFDNNASLSNITYPSDYLLIGSLIVSNNPKLESLDFIKNTTFSTEELIVINNDFIKDISIEEGTINGSFIVESNLLLESIYIVDSIDIETLRIIDNSALSELDFTNRSKDVESIQIRENASLSTFTLNSDVESIGNLSINKNNTLNTVNVNTSKASVDILEVANNENLEALNVNIAQSVAINIVGQEKMTELSGFNNAEIGSFILGYNKSLIDISNIGEGSTFNYIKLNNNDILSTCNVDFVCKLISENGTLVIGGNAEGCDNEDQIKVQCITSTKESILNRINIFPNPSSDRIKIESSSTITSIEIYNSVGQKMTLVDYYSPEIDISKLPRGLYILKISIDGIITTINFLKN